MATIGQNRVFDQSGIEECRQGGIEVLKEAERISKEMAALAAQVQTLYARVPGEAKEAGLDSLAGNARTTILQADYRHPREILEKLTGHLKAEVPRADRTAGENQHQAAEAAERAGRMVWELSELLDTGILSLPYEAFQEGMRECREELEAGQPDLEEKLRRAADTMCGLQKYTALYSPDPVHLVTGNLYYEKPMLLVGNNPLQIFTIYYNSPSRRKGPLMRGWSHSLQIDIHQSQEGPVLTFGDGARYYFTEEKEGTRYTPCHPGLTLMESSGGFLLNQEEGNSHRQYRFNQEGLLQEIREKGRSLYAARDKEGHLTALKEKDGTGLQFTYGEKGELCQVSDHCGRQLCLTYEGNRLAAVRNAEGENESYTYTENGKLQIITDERGIRKLKNQYDSRNRVIRQEYPDGGIQEYRYLDKEKKVEFKDTDGSLIIYTHDTALRNRKVKKEKGTESYTYTEKGQLSRYIAPDGKTTCYAYNEEGRTVEKKLPDGKKEKAAYDRLGRPVRLENPDGATSCFTYDEKEKSVSRRSPEGRTWKAVYDRKGSLRTLCHPDGSLQTAVYDAVGRMECLRMQDGKEYRYHYDQMNRLIQAGDTEGNQALLTYDKKDRLTHVRFPDGGERRFYYDACGFLIKSEDEEGKCIHLERDAMEGIVKLTNQSGGSIMLERDTSQRITAAILPTGERLAYGYEKGERRPARFPDGSHAVYDPCGRPSLITDKEGNRLILSYDPCGHLFRIGRGEESLLTLTRDACGRVTAMEVLGKKKTYTYDRDGNCLTEQEEGRETAYCYDDCGKLLWIQETGKDGIPRKRYRKEEKENKNATDRSKEQTTAATGYRLTWHYNESGFLTGLERDGVSFRKYTRDHCGRILTAEDALGNRKTFTYDEKGRLTAHTDEDGNKICYRHDSLGRLIETIHADGTCITYTYGEGGCLLAAEKDGERILLPAKGKDREKEKK